MTLNDVIAERVLCLLMDDCMLVHAILPAEFGNKGCGARVPIEMLRTSATPLRMAKQQVAQLYLDVIEGRVMPE